MTNDRGAAAADVSNVLVSCTTNQFTVGGAVAGLAGAGLALRLNGANELAVASNGAFTFQTPLESGAEYRVAVSSQPANPAQVCTVANGEGVVGAANVTGVRVTCASNTFSIGGVVNGLLGRGLVLQNNGEDPISVDGSGAFTFPRELAAGAGYNVTVRTQPSDPQQTCSVANGRGVVSGSDVTNIAVSCSTSEFTIGGVVRGLLGSGLRLRNGDEHLRIEDNGPFTFETPVPNGVRYDVRVEREPRRPRQSCTVRNGAGVVSGANVQNIEVECADDDDDDDDD